MLPPQIHRREFIDRAVLSALAALSLGTPRTSGAEPQTPPAGPNERLRAAVIGCNGQGGAHIGEWLRHPDVDLVAVCDVDPAAYAKHAKRFEKLDNPPKYVQDVRRLLDDPTIHVVSIATPNHWHALMAVWAMQAGKDVYVEKPCSHNVREGRVMTQWARKLGRMCQMGVQSRSMTGMRQTLEFVHSGELGEVRHARAICYRRRGSIGRVETPAPIPEGLDFDLWCGPAPLERPIRSRLHYDWHWVFATGNGDLGNQNPHELDKARWGLKKQELPQRVISLGGRLGYQDNGDVANSQVTVYQWKDAEIISDVRGLPLVPAVDFGLHVGKFDGASNIWFGTKGYAVGPNYTSGVAFDYDGKQLGKWGGGDYQAHFANLVKAIRSRDHRDLHLDIEDGHLSSALAHLGNVSYRLGQQVQFGTRPEGFADHKHVQQTFDTFEAHLTENKVDFGTTPYILGRPLEIDPQTELSTDPEANRLFTREYRKGYELPEVPA